MPANLDLHRTHFQRASAATVSPAAERFCPCCSDGTFRLNGLRFSRLDMAKDTEQDVPAQCCGPSAAWMAADEPPGMGSRRVRNAAPARLARILSAFRCFELPLTLHFVGALQRIFFHIGNDRPRNVLASGALDPFQAR